MVLFLATCSVLSCYLCLLRKRCTEIIPGRLWCKAANAQPLVFHPTLLGCAIWESGCLHWFRSHQKLQWICICMLYTVFFAAFLLLRLLLFFPPNGRRCSFLSHRVNWVVLLSAFYHDLPRYRNVENLSVMTRQAASSSTVKTSISPGRDPLPCEISAEYSLTADGTTGMNTKHECQSICR